MYTPKEIEEASQRMRAVSDSETEKEALKASEKAIEEFNEFKADLARGVCTVCKRPMKSFSNESPCLHWLTKPKGFKKNHFPMIYEGFSYSRLGSYTRWLATAESPFRNVNDLKDEHTSEKLIDFTARYKHITWSFSCGQGDFDGHKNAKAGNYPHYHLQMRIDNRQFINYNDFHIPFSAEDHAVLSIHHKDPKLLAYDYGIPTGIQSVFDSQEALEEVVEHCKPTENPEDSAFHVQTFVEAKPEERLSGEDIEQMILEAQSKGKSVASIVKEKFEGKAQVGTMISPSEGVVSALPRSPRKKKDNQSGDG